MGLYVFHLDNDLLFSQKKMQWKGLVGFESQETDKGISKKISYVNDYYNRTKMSFFTKNKYIFVDILSIN